MAGQFYKSYKKAMDGHDVFSMGMSSLGAPTNPMVAKQLEEFGKLLNQGIKNVEVGTISPEKFEFIPRQHFEEIRRLAKITDSKVSVHGPLIDLAGFPGEGRGVWTEDQRKAGEEQLFSILQRSYMLSNGENVPVVFHAGHFHSQEFEKGKKMTQFDKEGNIIIDPKTHKPLVKEEEMGLRSMTAVNQDTGEIRPLEWEEKKSIRINEEGKAEIVTDVWDPKKRLYSLNSTFWDQEKLKIQTRQKTIEELKEKLTAKMKQNETIQGTGLINNPEYQVVHEQNKRDLQWLKSHINNELTNLNSEFADLQDRYLKFSKEDDQEKYRQSYEKTQEQLKEINQQQESLNKEKQKIGELFEKAKDDKEKAGIIEKFNELTLKEITLDSEEAKALTNNISETRAPKLWRAVSEFAIDKTADTVAGALSKIYLELKQGKNENKTPFIALENFFVNSPMSTAEDLRKAVLESREKLVKKLVSDSKGKVNESEAKKAAEKLIGATWDVGHINNLRKAGFEGEELKKKVLEETSKIASLVRHVHVTDNFGFHDSHLPPGMGNVPIREIMEKLEKTWHELEKEGKLPQRPRSIVEAGGFVAEIGANPTMSILEYFGSPLYKVGTSPYFWGPEARSIGNTYTPYSESFIEFPQQHFSLYGSSFTTLPKSVGGQVGNEGSRFSGTPNQ